MDDGFLLLLSILAAGGFVWFAASFATGLEATGWPTAPGRILATEAELSGTKTGSGPFGKPLYVPRVRYEYVIEGRVYHGDRIRFGGGGIMSLERAREELRAWRMGAAVSVAFDPKDPMNATLERGADTAHAISAFGFGAASLVLFASYMGWVNFAG